MKCGETPGKPLNRYADGDVEKICRGCPLFATKPENTPDELVMFVAAAVTLDELRDSGATFAYPDTLEAFEWMSLTALTRGRNKAAKVHRKREEDKVPRNHK